VDESKAGNPAKTVVLIDDHDLIRQGLRRAFERASDFVVVGDAAGLTEGLKEVTRLAPDVVIMDLKLPDGNGLEATRKVRQLLPSCAIVVLTMYAGDEQLFGALQAGASAFVPKTAPAREVVSTARSAVASPASFTAGDLAGAMQRKLNPAEPRLGDWERQILDLLAEGWQISQIARHLYISTSTAKAHISKLYQKLGAANRTQALMAAVNLGLIRSGNDDEV
jgi:DNA-binding NarL/FixJ family response regulator